MSYASAWLIWSAYLNQVVDLRLVLDLLRDKDYSHGYVTSSPR